MNEPLLELLTIGREILDGRVVDTNSTEMALRLSEQGLTPRFGQRVDDDPERILQAFAIAQNRSDFVLVTGGLGPTSDDLSAETFAKFVKQPLELNSEALEQIRSRFEFMKRPMTAVQEKQAWLPRGCTILENLEGTAPGFSFRHEKTIWFFMPGVPREMLYILRTHVLPQLPQVKTFRRWQWATQFTSEGTLQEQLRPVIAKLPKGWEFTFRTRMPENHVGLLADTQGQCELDDAFEAIATDVRQILRGQFFHEGETLLELEAVVIDKARDKKIHIGTVESCTGGLVANRITDISGSSDVFWGSQVVYDNRMKEALGVNPHVLQEQGAVSKAVAEELALLGAQKLKMSGAAQALCVSTTGIAGPSGGTPTKPVGLCWIGISNGDWSRAEPFQVRPGLKRQDYKRFFAQKALDVLRQNL
jgi:nicotinamide-nucleotide amidase